MRTLEKALWWYTSSLEEKVLSSVLESSCLKEMRSTFVAFFVCLLFSATNAWSSSTTVLYSKKRIIILSQYALQIFFYSTPSILLSGNVVVK